MRLLVTSAAVFLAVSTAAHGAEWFTKTDEDVFTGKQTATMIGGAGDGESAYFACDGERQSSFAIIAKFEDEKTAGVPGLAVAKIDGGEPIKFDVSSYSHNDKYYGFRTIDTDSVLRLVEAVGKARKPILFGLQIPSVDFKFSFSVSPSGSGKAAAQFLKACKD